MDQTPLVSIVMLTDNRHSEFITEAVDSVFNQTYGNWEVLIGDSPRIVCEGRANDVYSLISNLQSEKFLQAKKKLRNYVEDYRSRLLSFHIQKVKGYKSASYHIISD